MQAGLTEIPTILRDMDDSDAAVVALVENLQRQDLNAIEEAEGYQRLLTDFGLTHKSLGYAVSKSRSHIGNTIRLLRLPEAGAEGRPIRHFVIGPCPGAD